MLVAAYHYVRGSASAAAQVLNIARTVPRDIPVIPDVEAGSGGIELTRQLIDHLRAVGYTVPLLYVPRWYWQQIGKPSLAGLPPLWSSRYPDRVVGSLADEIADVPAHYWDGYGGLEVEVLQFSSTTRIGGYAPVDANAYRGPVDQLESLLESDMPSAQEIAAAVWQSVLWHPDQAAGIKASDQLAYTNKFANLLPGLVAAVAAIANNQDITPEQLAAALDRAVAAHTPTAEQVAAAQLPHIQAAVREVLGEDNAGQADAIVDILAERLRAHT